MKQDIKQRWVEALRSGKYKQGTGRLRDQNADGDDEFCCLGVLGDLYDRNRWSHGTEYRVSPEDCRVGTVIAVLPSDVIGDIGLTGAQQDQLAEMNDHGSSFEEIARWIEENL
jgi:hypothetical protein